MRGSLTVGLWLAISLSVCLSADASIKIPVAQKDFGSVISGAVVEVKFEVINQGSEELVVGGETYGCPCFTTEATTIPPKGRRMVSVRFDTEGRRGYQTQDLRLRVSNQGKPVVVTLVGQILPPFRLAPKVLRMRSGAEGHAAVEIHGPVPFRILSCSSKSASQIAVDCVEAKEAPGPVQELIVEVTQPSEGVSQGEVTIEVQAESGRAVLTLPVVVLPSN